MYHSMYFQDDEGNAYNTWDNWFLVPSERPSIAPPSVNAPYDDFKDEFGGINLQLLDTNDVEYESRSGSHTWIIDNEYGEHGNWYDIYSDVMLKLHGKKMKVWLEDEPDYYYYGRLIVTNFKSEESYSTIEIQYLFEPYKYKMVPQVYSKVVKVPLFQKNRWGWPFIMFVNDDYSTGWNGFTLDENVYRPDSSFDGTYSSDSPLEIINNGKYGAPMLVKIYPCINDIDEQTGYGKLFYTVNNEEHSIDVSEFNFYIRRLRLSKMSYDKLSGSYKSMMIEDVNIPLEEKDGSNSYLYPLGECNPIVFDGINKKIYRNWQNVKAGEHSIYGARNSSISRVTQIYDADGTPSGTSYSRNALESYKGFYFPIAKPGVNYVDVGVSTGCYFTYLKRESDPSYAPITGAGNLARYDLDDLYFYMKYDVEVYERYI